MFFALALRQRLDVSHVFEPTFEEENERFIDQMFISFHFPNTQEHSDRKRYVNLTLNQLKVLWEMFPMNVETMVQAHGFVE